MVLFLGSRAEALARHAALRNDMWGEQYGT